MKNTAMFQTILGKVVISEQEGAITELFFANDTQYIGNNRITPLLEEAEKQLLEYFSGIRRTFDLKLAAKGTEFQKTVWNTLQEIAYGETRSYKQVAEMIGRPEASRAVGMANSKNPILIITPCHRIIGSDGKLVGYAGGLEIKKNLLEMENNHVSSYV